jgi:hypothetical protein
MTNSVKQTATKKNSTGIKMLIMAGSLAMTISGWAFLAAGQIGGAFAAAQQPPAITQPVNSSVQNNLRQVRPNLNPNTNSSQVAPPVTNARPRVRTQSSR